MERKSGVLMHISSLPSKYGIGSFGKCAYEFADFLYDCGFRVWQLLPFCMPDAHNSPYKSCASFGVNPYFIDLDILFDKGLITKEELHSAEECTPYLCEYDRLAQERLPLLALAAERARTEDGYEKKIDEFFAGHECFLRACEFMALKEANGYAPWQAWTVKIPNPVCLFKWKFIEYEFFNQWFALKEYVNSKGIELIGDLPMYVDLDSADVYFAPEMFGLNKKGYPVAVAGVPPDAFSEDGQLWGNPLYSYSRMKKDGYSWWRLRIREILSIFDGVRIDHFRAFASYWSVPKSSESAKEGRWIKGPGTALIDAIKKECGDRFIIAEDLGVITDEVKKLVCYSAFASMRVLQFAFSGSSDDVHLPHNYTENCIAYTGTHDNNTMLGYLYECSDFEREYVAQYCSASVSDLSGMVRECIKTLLRSSAGTVIFPIQDLLGYGADTRMNTPGTSSGNWAYRTERSQLDGIDRNYFRKLNSLYGRI